MATAFWVATTEPVTRAMNIGKLRGWLGVCGGMR